MPRRKKTYTKEFKVDAVARAEARGFKVVAEELGVHPNLLFKWRKMLEEDGVMAFPGQGKPRDEQLALLERENARLREEVAILKKAVGIFSKVPH